MQNKTPKLAVIGAGIAGLNLANLLSELAEVTVFEKSDKLGGRIATHSAEGFSFDHGAQFFTAKSPAFKSFIQSLQSQGVIARWDANFVEINGSVISAQRRWDETYPHYVGSPNMNAIGRYMAQNLDVRFNQHVQSVQRDQGAWLIKSTNAEVLGIFDWVVFAIPALQASALLPDICQFKADLNDVVMQPCFALMLGYDVAKINAWDAAIVSNSLLSWVSINSTKPNRSNAFTVLTTSRNNWADANFNQTDDFVVNAMLTELASVMGQHMADYSYLKLKRWKYANAARRAQQMSLLDERLHLACCGDWCKIGRIESAFTSSLDLAMKIKTKL
jgi:renalase